jgi:hypothetical protein
VPRSTNRPLLLAALAAALILACGPRAQHKDTVDVRDASTVSASSPDTAIAASTRVSVGGGVDLTLHVTNLHDHAIELRFPTGQTHEFAVLDSTGREIWRWSDGRLFTQTLQARLLGGRETMDFSGRWNGTGRRGRFTAVSTLRSENHPVQERVDFVLP